MRENATRQKQNNRLNSLEGKCHKAKTNNRLNSLEGKCHKAKIKLESSESSLEANVTRIKAKLIFVVGTGFEEGKVLAKYNKNYVFLKENKIFVVLAIVSKLLESWKVE